MKNFSFLFSLISIYCLLSLCPALLQDEMSIRAFLGKKSLHLLDSSFLHVNVFWFSFLLHD